MMCIIINDSDAVKFTFVFKSAVCTVEIFQSLSGRLRIDFQNISHSKCCQCVRYVVISVDRECDSCYKLSIFHEIERSLSDLVVKNICCTVVIRTVRTISYNTACKPVCDLVKLWNLTINNKCAVCRQ